MNLLANEVDRRTGASGSGAARPSNGLAWVADRGGRGLARRDRREQKILHLRRRNGGRPELRATWSACGAGSFGARCDANSGIGPVQEHICKEISADQENHRQENAANHNVEVARQNGFEKEGAEAWPAHDDLDEQRATHERTHAESEKRDEGICRGAKSVTIEKFPVGNAVTDCRSKEGSIENFSYRSADVPHEHR